jgi:hypothetical protein
MVVLNEGRVAADGSVRAILGDMALLEQARLEPPTLTKLFKKLNSDARTSGFTPLSIDEAVAWLKSSDKPAVGPLSHISSRNIGGTASMAACGSKESKE